MIQRHRDRADPEHASGAGDQLARALCQPERFNREAGPHRSGDIADKLGRSSSSLGPVRSSLITKGMIWSPTYGDTAFTVPLFDEFMRRIMPAWNAPACE